MLRGVSTTFVVHSSPLLHGNLLVGYDNPVGRMPRFRLLEKRLLQSKTSLAFTFHIRLVVVNNSRLLLDDEDEIESFTSRAIVKVS